MSAAVMTTGAVPKDLLPNINKFFGMEYAKYDTKYDKIFETHKSKRNFEEDVIIAGLALAQRKPEGSSIAYDTMKQGYTKRYTHETWGLGFTITREMMEDGQSDLIAKLRATQLANSMHHTKEISGANVLNNGFTAGAFAGGDGAALLSATHPTHSGNQSNILAVAADLSEASLEQAQINIFNTRDERNLRIKPTSQLLIIPRDLVFTAQRILKSELRVETADNDINAMKSLNMFPKGILMNPYLEDADAWFILTDIKDGLKYFTRREPVIEMENEFDNENAKYKATMRYSFGWSDWRQIYGSAGA